MVKGSKTQGASELAQSKARVAAIRERAQQSHEQGTPACSLVRQISRETESVIIDFFRRMLEGLPFSQRRKVEQNTSVVKMGGFGRGELAPYSDVDLLFLFRGTIDSMLTDALGKVVRDCWDAGIKLGQTVQNMRDAVRLGQSDLTFATSAIEARLLCGDAQLLNDFRQLFRRKVVDRNVETFVDECASIRNIERNQYGETVSQIQPNVKRSPGGLRDLHLIRWIGYARHQTAEIDHLDKVWALNQNDVQVLREAREFLTRIRCELHFHAGSPQDVLTREEQLRIAEKFGYEATPGRQPVENFMSDYFRYAMAVDEIAERLSTTEKPRAISSMITETIRPQRKEGIFVINGDQIDVRPRHHARLCSDLLKQVELFELAARTGLTPSPKLIHDIAESPSSEAPEICEKTAEAFLSILNQPGRVGKTLRLMYKSGVLEQIIPEMKRTRGLLEFNEYHQFTVDEHSLRAVEAVEAFQDEVNLLGQVYGDVRRKHLLYLALLLHDLGKGFEEDHCVAGGRIAADVAERLRLKESHRDRLVFLVEQHLIMSHLAFRRDITDMNVILPFARDIGSLDMLRMLYTLTAADITAVGPGTWNEWKGGLLGELYERALLLLSGFRNGVDFHERLTQLRWRARHYVDSSPVLSGKMPSENWLAETLDTLPDHYLSQNNVEQVVDDLMRVAELKPADAIIDWYEDATSGTVLYRIVADDSVAAGCFSKMSGVMAAMGLEIVSAEICTTSAGIVMDKFRIVDLEYEQGTPQVRLDDIKKIIRDVLTGRRTVKSLFERRRQTSDTPVIGPVWPPRIVFDNNSSDLCTVIDIFARNRSGLLYAITDALFGLDLSVQLAKICTYGNTVVDVFYVTQSNGAKLEDPEELQRVSQELQNRVEEFDRNGFKTALS